MIAGAWRRSGSGNGVGRGCRTSSAHLEQRIIAFVLAYPVLGPKRIAAELRREKWGGLRISPNGVWRVLCRRGLARGVRLIAGVDEVGAGGCWAGPIMAAGVLFDLERLARAVLAHAEAVALVSIPASQIDRIGLRAANLACLERALRAVGERAELRFVDGYALGASAPVHERIVRGDATSATVAAASIVAKVTRDRLMCRLGERYPGYGFEGHKGYGTKEHKAAVAKLGPTREHRLTFDFRHLTETVVAAAPARRRKPRRASWRELPAAEMAAHLLETPTISDRAWTDERRLPRETRTAFIRRVLLDETEPVEAGVASPQTRVVSGRRP